MVFAISALTCFAAYFVKGMCGFANTLIYTSVMSFFADTVTITPMEMVLSIPSSAVIAWKNRKEVQLRLVLPIAGVMVAGCVVGVLLLKETAPRILKLVFGGAVIAIGIEMLLRDRAKKRRESPVALTCIGIVTGLMSGLFGVGVLLSAYMSRTTENNASFRGNMCAVFVLNDIARLILYIGMGVLTGGILLEVAKLIPFMAAGLWLGMKCMGKVSEKMVRRAVCGMLLVSGVMLIIKNLL